ncbi:hypothetical protein PG999_003337 [Apiospora kogelbergensis]|uniref:Uncharacterized protein n=1 Tax=Apiospora kogelbergensis TaxID=1337665 RepID=A0AAW0R3B4_9PEZI
MITRATIFLMATLPIAVHALSLNITAITANGAGSSIFECWSLDAPLVTSTQPGLVGAASSFLGDVANMTYSVTPVSFHNENHNAPYNQQAPLVHSIGNSALIYLSRWVIPIAGIGIVTLPDDPATDLYITKDIPSGIFFAADTADISHVGHGNLFPGYTSVIIMQIPTLGNKVPKHTVLHAGYCTSNDTIAQLRIHDIRSSMLTFVASGGLFISIDVSALALIADLRDWTSSESLLPIVAGNRPSIGIAVQVISHLLGFLHLFSLYMPLVSLMSIDLEAVSLARNNGTGPWLTNRKANTSKTEAIVLGSFHYCFNGLRLALLRSAALASSAGMGLSTSPNKTSLPIKLDGTSYSFRGRSYVLDARAKEPNRWQQFAFTPVDIVTWGTS